jgi:hypothetical protein
MEKQVLPMKMALRLLREAESRKPFAHMASEGFFFVTITRKM